MTGGSSAKVFTHGTHRVRLPEETWAMIEPRLPDYGVTRVSDVTGLDTLGIPTAMAARPLSWTLCVSQGKGQTMTLAKVSAAMESVELWHAERAVPPLTHTGVPARELDLSYSVRDLAVEHGPFSSDDARLDWVEAVGMNTGRRMPVPRDAVFFPDPHAQHWSPTSMRTNSNGLASGNVRDEAALHALYEVVERDVLGRPTARELARWPCVEPESIPDDTCLRMVRSVRAAGGRMSVQHLPNPYGIPTYRAVVWSWDFPLPCTGYGSHSDPLVAVSRAVTEAAQGRLAAIVGSRDDLDNIHDHLHRPRAKVEYLSQFPTPTRTFDEETPARGSQHDDVSDELQWLAARVQEVTGTEPLLLDLSTDSAFSVVKVVLPGSQFARDRVHAKLERTV
jgi:ribosomal protein S12 methylthiotransferase accessory factor